MVKRYYDDSDPGIWTEYIRHVRPLNGHPKTATSIVRPAPGKSIPSVALPREILKTPSSRQLKNVHIHARLDLHGHTMERAHEALLRFVDESFLLSRRCVLVITGKGKSDVDLWWNEGSNLRQQVPRWLREPIFLTKITTFTTARPEHGGEGALYVFIRKSSS